MAIANIHSNYLIGDGSRVKPRKLAANSHMQGYDDDGLIITMTLRSFFGALNDYSKFLDGGARAYISLTDERGGEAFQFSLTNDFNNGSSKIIPSCAVGSKDSLGATRKVMKMISKAGSPFSLTSLRGHPYGFLYPSVTLVPVLDKE